MTAATSESLVPQSIRDSLQRYVEHRLQPGGFLTAVLTNDLREAVARADDQNVLIIPAIVAYIYNRLPGSCWGSQERVTDWLNA